MEDIQETKHFQIAGMDCTSCARTIETGVGKLDDVEAASLNFTTATLRVTGPIAPERVVARVQELGYDVVKKTADGGRPTIDGPHQSPMTGEHQPGLLAYLWQRWETRLALIATLLIIPGLLFDELLPGLGIESPLFAGMAVLAMILAGYPIAQNAVRALRVNREITINLLMSIAAVGAVIIGAYTEAGLVMVLFALGEALEGYTADRARNAIRGLSELAPSEAIVLRDSAEVRLPVGELVVGDRIVVRPGERLPMDGRVLAGTSTLNQAPITGESRPIDKMPGDEVFAGSVNGHGTLEIEVTHLAEDTTISRMIALVSEAQDRRAPAQRFVDEFARVYTPAVIAIAVLVATIPPLVFGQPFWNPSPDVHGWLYRALALLVVACPCALVISTPVTLISAISNGARNGVLFKGGAYLEELSRVQAVAFDKTGTITRGTPAVVAIGAAGCATPGDECAACDDLLALAAAVERRSEHPLAQAVLAEAKNRGLETRYAAGQSVTALAGQGVTGQVNGHKVTIGSHAFFDGVVAHLPFCEDIHAAEAEGHSTMLVSRDEVYEGYISVADTLRDGSSQAIAQLRDLGLDPLVMLTGDHIATAKRIAAEVGLADIEAGLLPAGKVDAIEALRREHGHVAMVGDGINDTPAFATASVGLAMGRTAQALETADVVLLGDDLRQLPFAVRLARQAMSTVRFNIALSIAIKLVFFVLVLVGTGSMWMAVLADMGTSLLVTLNGMRLLRRPVLDL
ncbi:MAG: heavy metal translocating P-type ATPase [Chloroflexota bacterium]